MHLGAAHKNFPTTARQPNRYSARVLIDVLQIGGPKWCWAGAAALGTPGTAFSGLPGHNPTTSPSTSPRARRSTGEQRAAFACQLWRYPPQHLSLPRCGHVCVYGTYIHGPTWGPNLLKSASISDICYRKARAHSARVTAAASQQLETSLPQLTAGGSRAVCHQATPYGLSQINCTRSRRFTVVGSCIHAGCHRWPPLAPVGMPPSRVCCINWDKYSGARSSIANSEQTFPVPTAMTPSRLWLLRSQYPSSQHA